MKLSVIIVNYNVRFFLEQCLQSITEATKGIPCEVFVVDNNSTDDSMEMVREKFPYVKRIENKVNLGFSKANNQAIKKAEGEYVLLLNPDTVVAEDCFVKCVDFLDSHPDAGGLGVKMVDGQGRFLPESKRGLPTPAVAFYKIFGLSSLFPRSKRFSKYHLGHLENDKTHEIEVLSGACMFLRKKMLDKIGLLDETFFMYGEDIDLSYRVLKGGYKNYYYPDAKIIHYKGESTKKSSINYVLVFYKAMIIFAQKHFSGKNAKTFSLLINLAIYLRAFIAILSRFFKHLILPAVDSFVLLGGMYLIKQNYEKYKFDTGSGFPDPLVLYILIGMTTVWVVSLFLSGSYDKPYKLNKIFKGAFFGSIINLIAYAFLNEELRFSRVVVLLSAAWAITGVPITRLFLHILGLYKIKLKKRKRIAVIGFPGEINRIKTFLKQVFVQPETMKFIYPIDKKVTHESEKYDAKIYQLKDATEIFKIDEVIFCAKDIGAGSIISKMLELNPQKVNFKIAPLESSFIIGSNSIDKSGEFYHMETSPVNKPANRRKKRLMDIFVSLLILLISPIIIWVYKKPFGFLSNCLNVLRGNITWVDVNSPYMETEYRFKKGILQPYQSGYNSGEMLNSHYKLNYIKNYSYLKDLELIMKNLFYLDKEV